MTSDRAFLEAEVLTPKGETLPLARLWRAQPAVIVLVRHFG